jgi:hypothetical protein
MVVPAVQSQSRSWMGFSTSGNEVAFDVCTPFATSLNKVRTDTR